MPPHFFGKLYAETERTVQLVSRHLQHMVICAGGVIVPRTAEIVAAGVVPVVLLDVYL